MANPHSLSETVQYAKEKSGLTETASVDREYIEQIKCLKESLILQHEPELLGEMIAEMPDSVIPMDFHLYKIEINDNILTMKIDYTWNIFGMSYSGNNAVMKNFKKIVRDLYGYYSVTEEDIINKTERYSSLVTSLIELAKRDGLIKGFFDFRDDAYRNVVICSFGDDTLHLKFGGTLNLADITKIEELIDL